MEAVPLKEILKMKIFGYSLFSYLAAFLYVALFLLVFRILEKVFFKKLGEFLRKRYPNAHGTLQSILIVLRVAVWGVACVFALDNLGFNVSAVLAGLGIGGVAVALAVQTILGDLFNYFVVCFDKPFEAGDFIVVDKHSGVVENIGVKSTRVRSLDGEQLVFSNSDLTGSRIRNFKRMAERRVLFKLGLIYETPPEKIPGICDQIRKIIQSIPKTRVDRVHFKEFGDFSLNFEVVYYVLSSDYNQYMDTQQKINLSVMEYFKKEGFEFAYPTTVEYVYPQKVGV